MLREGIWGDLARSSSIATQDSAAAADSRSVSGEDRALWINRAACEGGNGGR